MGPAQHEPEIQFAQRLASNEKPTRTQAIKKLRKYIIYRSQKGNGGFTGDELLKLWKGLFYCLWMQDKPLLQEELSEHISGLIHLFQTVESQFLFLEAFIQTLNREWTGIDRLRMDKFFQLVRFVFRQTFELLKKKNWETSLVTKFLELLKSEVLQSSSGAPAGLQFHVMDVYMAELAKVGSAELTADQNLTLIDPFCKTAAKTKSRILLRAICSTIFSAIIDQAPFAIEELMNEMKAAGGADSDSGQASQDDDDEVPQKVKVNPKSKKGIQIASDKTGCKTEKQANGTASGEESEEEEEEEDDDNDEDEHLHSENDAMFPDDEGCGPVLQFDYSTLADRLFGLAKRSKTPSFNRKKLYKVIKQLRDLSEGEFPQNEYPEEVSTDEDDDEMFGSRKRMKRGSGYGEDDGPAAKKSKKIEVSMPKKSNKSSSKDESQCTATTPDVNQKRKRRRRKKKKIAGGEALCVEQTEGSEVKVSVTISLAELETPAPTSPTTEGEMKDTVEMTELLKADVNQSTPSDVEAVQTEVPAAPEESSTERIDAGNISTVAEDQCRTPLPGNTSSNKDAKVKGSELETSGSEPCEEVMVVEVDQTEIIPEKTAPTTKGKGKKKRRNVEKNAEAESENPAEPIGGAEIELKTTSCVAELPLEDDIPIPLKKKKKTPKKKVVAVQAEETDANVEVAQCAETELGEVMVSIPVHKKKKEPKDARIVQLEPNEEDQLEQPMEIETATAIKKKKKKPKVLVQEVEMMCLPQSEDADEIPTDEVSTGSKQPASSKKEKKKKKKKVKEVADAEAEEVNDVETIAVITDRVEDEPVVKKAKMRNSNKISATTVKKSLKKKAKTGSPGFVTFQSNPTLPTPLFCKVKGSPSTPLSSKKKIQTPGSDSKKVTFGLKNNKTAEFRKNDRSLLVSPDGSSRVPFDPQQKPRCGVLKSPARSVHSVTKIKKSAPKGRPTAADFF